MSTYKRLQYLCKMWMQVTSNVVLVLQVVPTAQGVGHSSKTLKVVSILDYSTYFVYGMVITKKFSYLFDDLLNCNILYMLTYDLKTHPFCSLPLSLRLQP